MKEFPIFCIQTVLCNKIHGIEFYSSEKDRIFECGNYYSFSKKLKFELQTK